MRTCVYCGAEFAWERQPGQRGRTRLYCSALCAGRARARPTRGPSDPDIRSAAASTAAAARWNATPPEARSAAARRAAEARYTPEQRAVAAARRADRDARRLMPCPYCGDPVGRAGRAKCPKPECNLAHNAARMRKHLKLRRARRYGVHAEVFEPGEVFDRDGWVCGVCDLPVDRNLSWPDPGSPSLDHIVPLARGGEHTRSNTQLAHLYCNACKGVRESA